MLYLQKEETETQQRGTASAPAPTATPATQPPAATEPAATEPAARVYCIPFTFLTGWQIFYNPDLLAQHDIEVPTTMEEFLAASEKLASVCSSGWQVRRPGTSGPRTATPR